MTNKYNSQESRIKRKLNRDGFITRNECLKNYISRLGAVIFTLKKENYEFKAEDMENGDYRYTWINRKVLRIIEKEDGTRVAVPKIEQKQLL